MKGKEFWVSEHLLPFQEQLCSITFVMLFCILLPVLENGFLSVFLNAISLVNILHLYPYKSTCMAVRLPDFSKIYSFNYSMYVFCCHNFDINGLWVVRYFLQWLVQGGPGGCLKGPGSQKPLPTTFSPSDQTQVVYRVVGSRSHVKKSDSSQQTDSSAFR